MGIALATKLNIECFRYGDNHPDWYNGTPFRSMFLAYLWATVENRSLASIPDRLQENLELAEA